MQKFVIKLFILFELMLLCSSCGFPPPMPMCGCGCGRKKREIAVRPLLKNEDIPCPQIEWKKLIDDNLKDNDPITSVNTIQTAFLRHYSAARFLVNCGHNNNNNNNKTMDSIKNKIYMSSGGDGYCSISKTNLWCQVVALSA